MKRFFLLLIGISVAGAFGVMVFDNPSIGNATSLSERVRNTPANERASYKGQEIAKSVRPARFNRSEYEIEIVEVNAIEKGVEVFARAWKNGEQIGFGKDGTVDVERFVKYTPGDGENGHLTHIVVPDPQGDIAVEYDVEDPATREKIGTRTETYREDPKENLLIWLEHNLSVMKNVHGSERIVAGKRGNTTSTFNPAAGANAPVDGTAARITSSESFTTIVNGAGTTFSNTSSAQAFAQHTKDSVSTWANLYRAIVGFDTSSIGSDTVSSATLSIFGTGANDESGLNIKVIIDRNVPGSDDTLANSDYNVANWDGVKQSDTEIGTADWDTAGYNDYALNATGIGNINGTGYSWYGGRTLKDLNDDSYAGNSTTDNVDAAYADNADSNKHPKLVVEHAAAVVEVNRQDVIWFD